jgi:hypothetical protein
VEKSPAGGPFGNNLQIFADFELSPRSGYLAIVGMEDSQFKESNVAHEPRRGYAP